MRGKKKPHLRFEYQPGAGGSSTLHLALGWGPKLQLSCCLPWVAVACEVGKGICGMGEHAETVHLALPHHLSPLPPQLITFSNAVASSPDLDRQRDRHRQGRQDARIWPLAHPRGFGAMDLRLPSIFRFYTYKIITNI